MHASLFHEWQPLHHLHSLHTHGDDLADEADDVLLVVQAFGSLVMWPLSSLVTRYWSITHSSALRLPRR
jgi:hypothetical protein